MTIETRLALIEDQISRIKEKIKSKEFLEPEIGSIIKFYFDNWGQVITFYHGKDSISGWRLITENLGIELFWSWIEILKYAKNSTIEINLNNWKILK